MITRVACIITALCAAFVLPGCGKKEPVESAPAAPAAPTKISVSDSAPEAPPPPPQAAAATEAPRPDGPPPEENIDELTKITRAIQSFAVNYERPPKDLNELVAKKVLPSLPVAPAGKKFLYDPSRMSIKLVNQ